MRIPVEVDLAHQFAVEHAIEVRQVTFIDRGYSFDRKYRLDTDHGPLLLRISHSGEAESRRNEFRLVARLSAHGVLAPEGITFAERGERCFGLYRYVEGENGEDLIPSMSPADQRKTGLESGAQLKLVHAAHPSPGHINEAAIRGPKFRRSCAELRQFNHMVEGMEGAEAYVESHLHLAEDRPSVFRHGDFHPANLIFRDNRFVGVIDFNRCDFGDPFDDFYKLALFSAPLSPEFTCGVIRGYFGGEPTPEFWPLYNLYVGAILASDIMWTQKLYPEDLRDSYERVTRILRTHDFDHGGPPEWWLAT